MLIEEIYKRKGNGNQRTEHKNRNQNKPSHQYSGSKYERLRKYCDIHKSKSHSNEECRKQKSGNKNDTEKVQPKGFAMCEQSIKPKIVEIQIKIADEFQNALVDTGATYNFISDELSKKSDSPQLKLSKPVEVETASGDHITCEYTKFMDFQIKGDKQITYKSLFYIFPSKTSKVILGMQFLQENDAIINIKENFITLDNREYEIELSGNKLDKNDEIIIEKSKIYSLDDINPKFERLIHEYKLKNPEIGHIKTVKHEIKLNNEFHPKFKEYTVPLHLRNELNEHLQELERLNIISRKEVKYASPAFPIRKKNHKIRLVIDYRELNRCTEPMEVTFPTIADILSSRKR
ncbi:Transposon Tf2-8 polyprotein [Dictyocoela muelleri]|nr:Transposon Tf2-8 polyprotein [Dictyocoela muelleri]